MTPESIHLTQLPLMFPSFARASVVSLVLAALTPVSSTRRRL